LDEVAEPPDRQELLTALTTEHFTLQGARSQTASESASRASLYILSVSSASVALGFIGQASQIGTAFYVFALTVLPTLYVLGVSTFVRVVECAPRTSATASQSTGSATATSRSPATKRSSSCSPGTTTDEGCSRTLRCRPRGASSIFTFATVVAVINSVVGGSAIALGAIADTSLGVAAGVGGVVGRIRLTRMNTELSLTPDGL
jgi:hypothetical protein